MYGRISVPKVAPPWLGDVHRLSGSLAFLFTLLTALFVSSAVWFWTDSSFPSF
jgi:hypothetical protein